jgi:hypothetical protein
MQIPVWARPHRRKSFPLGIALANLIYIAVFVVVMTSLLSSLLVASLVALVCGQTATYSASSATYTNPILEGGGADP